MELDASRTPPRVELAATAAAPAQLPEERGMKATVSPGESIGTLFVMPPLNIRFVLLCAYATWVVDGVADGSAEREFDAAGGADEIASEVTCGRICGR